MFSRIKSWAARLKRDGHAIYLASRDPRVPWYAKALAIAVAAYALSPIDLIPDFIPVIGYLDELIILPLGIWLVVCADSRRGHGRVSRQGRRGRAASNQQSRNGRDHPGLDCGRADAGMVRLCLVEPAMKAASPGIPSRRLP